MKLSENFTLQELTKSDTAIRLGIPNEPNSDQIAKLQNLCETLLQPVRDEFGPVIITSGFRSAELCVKIGSSINSQHAKAEAADAAERKTSRRTTTTSSRTSSKTRKEITHKNKDRYTTTQTTRLRGARGAVSDAHTRAPATRTH